MNGADEAQGPVLKARRAGAAAARRIANIEPLSTKPPRWLFHLPVVALSCLTLWSVSVPGVVFWLVPAWLGLAFLALLWGIRAIAFASRLSQRSGSIRSLRWFLVAPILGTLTLTLVFVNAPFRARWAWSRPSFEKAVQALEEDASVQAEDDWARVAESRRVGLYHITSTERVSGGYLFYEANGAFINFAGFAYLPDGPHEGLNTGWFEAPEFQHLGGPWYAWTASW